MFIIKLLFTLIYYGSVLYLLYISGKNHQIYLEIQEEYTQVREHAFPNLTEQEHKQRNKKIAQYYEKMNPSFSKKRIVVGISYGIGLYMFCRGFLAIFARDFSHVLFYWGISLLIITSAGFYFRRSKKNEREILQQYLINNPQNELQVVLVPETLYMKYKKNMDKKILLLNILGLIMVFHPLFFHFGYVY
ncbi:MAG: hypothetical protein H9W82_14350 [Lactobacillus sp.]|nr:hypothetical protein [Lactobacillus sp.]